MSRGAMFAVVSLGLVGVTTGLLFLWYDAPAERTSVLAAAVTALMAQAITWVIIARMGQTQVIAAWGLGAVVRVVVLVLFSIVGPRAFGLRLEPATLSLALFLFVTTLVEPLFLKS